jgi:uncharacterized lipoprotein YmbA
MMRRRCAALASALLLAGCGSAPPTHFHTLMAPADNAAVPAAHIAWQLLPVGLPAQVDQPQMVVRDADGSVALLEHERWIAPLADEYRNALAERLTQLLGPALGRPASEDRKLWRFRVDVQRFDSLPGQRVREDIDWAVAAGGRDALVCRSSLEGAAGGGYAQLAAAHRALLARLAEAIAAALSALDAGRDPGCPSAG